MNWHLSEITGFFVVIAILTAMFYCQWENERQSYFKNSHEPPLIKAQLKLALNFHVKEHSYPTIGRYRLLSGSGSAFMRYYAFSRKADSIERIIGAAIEHPCGMIYVALNPGRHHHVIRMMDYMGVAGLDTTRRQGYMTTSGRFVDRRTGLHLATLSKQIVKKHPASWELYSEDMW